MTPAAHPSQHAPELRAATRHIGRRRFLTATGAAAALAFATNLPSPGVAAAAELDAARITENPFTLGVASGDPLPGSVILWTRLAPPRSRPTADCRPNASPSTGSWPTTSGSAASPGAAPPPRTPSSTTPCTSR
jgi:hypothetical protein